MPIQTAAKSPSPIYTPLVTDRAAYEGACRLIDRFGAQAGIEAADRAESARVIGNHLHFCHWRQIERLIVLLSVNQCIGTVH